MFQQSSNSMSSIIGPDLEINGDINIKGDLFVIHGRRDRNVSYKQVLELKNALDDKGIPYEYMIRGDEAHGFYAETNNLELYVEMEKFLKRNLN